MHAMQDALVANSGPVLAGLSGASFIVRAIKLVPHLTYHGLEEQVRSSTSASLATHKHSRPKQVATKARQDNSHHRTRTTPPPSPLMSLRPLLQQRPSVIEYPSSFRRHRTSAPEPEPQILLELNRITSDQAEVYPPRISQGSKAAA